jgi:hypothetical protein
MRELLAVIIGPPCVLVIIGLNIWADRHVARRYEADEKAQRKEMPR